MNGPSGYASCNLIGIRLPETEIAPSMGSRTDRGSPAGRCGCGEHGLSSHILGVRRSSQSPGQDDEFVEDRCLGCSLATLGRGSLCDRHRHPQRSLPRLNLNLIPSSQVTKRWKNRLIERVGHLIWEITFLYLFKMPMFMDFIGRYSKPTLSARSTDFIEVLYLKLYRVVVGAREERNGWHP